MGPILLAGDHSTNDSALAYKAEKDLVKEISVVGGGVVQRWEPRSVINISWKI